jgi:hypothetical protein
LVWVFAEDVADDYCGFLDDVGYLGGNEVEERRDAEFGGGFDFDSEFADGADGFADEVYVDFCGVSGTCLLVK